MRTRIDPFKEEGFSIIGNGEIPNKLMEFIKEHYPQIIRDNELKLDELKSVLGLPIDEKVNGYGLNFIGRNVARSKYAAPTDKELKINRKLSKNFDTTQNLVLKGDNLDTLKILKSYYSGKIKCIYIDPPYNTTSDEFVYPDKFDEEEAEVLGLANLSQEDMDRLEFSFGTKKSHNGWLSFMYPRLVLARDLLTEDGVIFISIDDNEQANLKLLCDEIFGEENFVGNFVWIRKKKGAFLSKKTRKMTEYVLCYQKQENNLIFVGEKAYSDKKQPIVKRTNSIKQLEFPKNLVRTTLKDGFYSRFEGKGQTDVSFLNDFEVRSGLVVSHLITKGRYVWTQSFLKQELKLGSEVFLSSRFGFNVLRHDQKNKTKTPSTLIDKSVNVGTNEDGSAEVAKLFETEVGEIFDYTKPITLITFLANFLTEETDIILDFFAGSGTTGHAVMQLNSEDNGNRKFILCQIDEPIAENKPAYQFCKVHNLEPVISSITIERLRRAGEKIKTEIEEENKKAGLFKEDQKQIPDIGFKVFDTVSAPELELIDGKISFPKTDTDSLSRIYNMLFSVGIDDPTSPIETIVEDSIYKIGNHYYITNSEKISKEDLAAAIANGKVFIDGWTASINASLQHYKEDVEIVF